MRATSKAQLLDAGLVLLSSDAVGGVQKLLSPEALQQKTRESDGDGVSRHTAYRLWEDRGEAVIDLARHVAEINAAGNREVFAEVLAIQVAFLTRYDDEGRFVVDMDRDTMRAGLREMNRGIFEGQLAANEVPATWTLHGAALTSSRLWRGRPPDDELARVGHEVLLARGGFYTEVKRLWSEVYDGLLSWWGRRIRPDHRVEALTDLVVALFDGLMLQMFVDPDLNDVDDSPEGERRRGDRARRRIDDASDGIFEVFWAYSEPAIRDPRRATSVLGDEAFDRLVATAAERSAGEPGSPLLVADVAAQAQVPAGAAAGAFPEAGDLADSVLRRLIAPSGLELGVAAPMTPVPLIELALRRTHRVARERPALVAAARGDLGGGPSFLAELREATTEALGSPGVACPKPGETADLLVDLTLDREDRWGNVETLLSVLAASPPAAT